MQFDFRSGRKQATDIHIEKNIKAVLECNKPLPVCVACRMSADMLLIIDYAKEAYKD